jgi:hypothetical protein
MLCKDLEYSDEATWMKKSWLFSEFGRALQQLMMLWPPEIPICVKLCKLGRYEGKLKGVWFSRRGIPVLMNASSSKLWFAWRKVRTVQSIYTCSRNREIIVGFDSMTFREQAQQGIDRISTIL